MVGRVVQVQEDMEDVCQEVFIKVYKELGTFRHEARISTWIATIAYRVAINYLNKKKSHKTINFDNIISLENRYSSQNTPDKVYFDTELGTMIRKMIESLPVNYRTVVTLYHLQEFTYNEISEITGMPEGTVISYLFRARKIIQEKLRYLINSYLLITL